MKIGIDARPLKKQRAGIGTYVYNIVKYLNDNDPGNEYYLFSNKEIIIDFELKDNWHTVVENFPVGTLWLGCLGVGLRGESTDKTVWDRCVLGNTACTSVGKT